MAVARASLETLASIATRVQAKLGDPDGDRWPLATHVYPAINDQLIEMANIAQINHAGSALSSTDLSYTGGATAPVDLPSGVVFDWILRVEDVTSGERPVELRYVSPQDGVVTGTRNIPLMERRYTLMAPTTDYKTGRIRVFPDPASTATLRIYHVLEPWVVATTSDEIPFSTRWRELVFLGAIRRCLENDDEMTGVMMDNLREQKALFAARATQRQGRIRVARTRRGF